MWQSTSDSRCKSVSNSFFLFICFFVFFWNSSSCCDFLTSSLLSSFSSRMDALFVLVVADVVCLDIPRRRRTPMPLSDVWPGLTSGAPDGSPFGTPRPSVLRYLVDRRETTTFLAALVRTFVVELVLTHEVLVAMEVPQQQGLEHEVVHPCARSRASVPAFLGHAAFNFSRKPHFKCPLAEQDSLSPNSRRFKKGYPMSKAKSTPMTREAASRIASSSAKQHGGQIPPRSFASRADAAAQRAAATAGRSQGGGRK